MSNLICDFVAVDEKLKVKAPSIGRVSLGIKLHDVLVGGQVIGKLWRLNQGFDLKLAESCQGEVAWLKDGDAVFTLGYGEPFLVLEAKSHAVNIKHAKPADAQKYIDSPLDGLFYLSASPESPGYVKVGDEVSPGQVLGLIEVMKCFYPLKYQGSSPAKITGIMVSNQTPVTTGTHLFAIG